MPKSNRGTDMIGNPAKAPLTVTLAMLGLAACATLQPAKVETVAQSGIKFADSVSPLLKDALNEAIASNSDSLMMAHAKASTDTRRTALLEVDSAYRERAKIFADVDDHAQLLKTYFVTLMAIGETSGDSAIGAEAEALVNKMGTLDKSIANHEIGGRSVASITGAVTPLVVADLRSAAVERELREHGDDIVKAVELQQSFLRAVAGDLQSEFAAEQQEQEFRNVIEPYLSSNPLPSDWKALRADALADGQTQSVAALNAAATTAENLKISFIAMAGGNKSGGLFAQLENDVDRLVALVTAIRGAAPPAS
jgi:hypothetical protein